ncbi:MAG: FecR domain-containing protein [Gemmatimonadaceae bacterium]
MSQHEISDAILDRFVAGEASALERAVVEAWLRERPDRAAFVAALRDRGEGSQDWSTDAAWSALRARIDAAPPHAMPRRWLTPRVYAAAAAVFVAVGTLGVLALRARVTPPVGAFRDLATGRGERTSVTLEDGTQIRLGVMSHVRYSVGAAAREVTLSGAASFDVTHDRARPFVVHAAGAQIVDLGTSFTVRAYAADSAVIVAVSTGRVSLGTTARANAAALELGRGQVGAVGASGDAVLQPAADVSRYSAWLDGRLAFDNQPLSAVAAELGRWFVVDVRFASPALARRRISAVYSQPDLTAVLDAIAASLGVSYTRAGRVVTFGAVSK